MKESLSIVLALAELGSMDHRAALEAPEEYQRQCDAICNVEALETACKRPYSLAELRNGTGFPAGARFVMIEPYTRSGVVLK